MIRTFLKGLLMGAADAVPGVSGGTIAFITGIYDRFVRLIASFGLSWWRSWRAEGWPGLSKHLDFQFSMPLLAGILLGILAISKTVLSALEHYPALIWSLFLGLVLAAVPIVLRGVSWRNQWPWLVLGIAVASGIGLFGWQLPQTMLGVFVAGFIALSAMILPGISGSFLLLLLGMYSTVFEAVHAFDLAVVGLFALGGALGILTMAKVLSWAFEIHPGPVRTLLAGLMVGSAAQLWPFQHAALSVANGLWAVVGFSLGGVLLWWVDRLAQD